MLAGSVSIAAAEAPIPPAVCLPAGWRDERALLCDAMRCARLRQARVVHARFERASLDRSNSTAVRRPQALAAFLSRGALLPVLACLALLRRHCIDDSAGPSLWFDASTILLSCKLLAVAEREKGAMREHTSSPSSSLWRGVSQTGQVTSPNPNPNPNRNPRADVVPSFCPAGRFSSQGALTLP